MSGFVRIFDDHATAPLSVGRALCSDVSTAASVDLVTSAALHWRGHQWLSRGVAGSM